MLLKLRLSVQYYREHTKKNGEGVRFEQQLIGKQVIVNVGKVMNSRRSVENREAQVLEKNRNLESRLMQIVSQRNLNVQLASDRPSVSELVDVLVTNRIFPKEERRSRDFADSITRIADKAARGEPITEEEFNDYTIAMSWFDDLEDMQRQQ